jgi:uncharacterized protein YegJ (DUF2314 family)
MSAWVSEDLPANKVFSELVLSVSLQFDCTGVSLFKNDFTADESEFCSIDDIWASEFYFMGVVMNGITPFIGFP